MIPGRERREKCYHKRRKIVRISAGRRENKFTICIFTHLSYCCCASFNLLTGASPLATVFFLHQLQRRNQFRCGEESFAQMENFLHGSLAFRRLEGETITGRNMKIDISESGEKRSCVYTYHHSCRSCLPWRNFHFQWESLLNLSRDSCAFEAAATQHVGIAFKADE